MDSVLPNMNKDEGELAKQCLSWLFTRKLARHFPEHLSVELITAALKSGDKADMSSYRGITRESVIAQLFETILEHRIPSWLRSMLLKPRGRQASEKPTTRLTIALFRGQ